MIKNKLRLPFFLFFLAGFIFFAGCKSKEDINVPKQPEILGIATPVYLQPDSTILVLSDYFLHPKAIDSILTDKNLSVRISPDTTQLTLIQKDKNLPKLSVMKVWIDGFCYSLMIEKSKKIWHHLGFDPKGKTYKRVEISGEMNDWSPKKSPMHLKDGKWETSLFLEPGKYTYLIVADGKPMIDPGNPEVSENLSGKKCSLFRTGSLNPPGTPYLWTEKADKNKISIGVKNKNSEIFVFWQNYRLDEKFVTADSSGLKIKIPSKASEFDRSFIRVWAYNGAGLSNELLIPLQEDNVITDATKLTREDREAMIVYFMLVDRFCNGNPKNDAPLKDKSVDQKLNFQGGDLTGISEKIKDGYFTNMGVNTLFLAPITQNPMNAWVPSNTLHHKSSGFLGIWPVTLSTIDTRFGTSDDLKNLVSEAHGKNINIWLDVIPNQVHQDSKIYKEHPGWTTPLLLPKKKKNVQLWDEQRYTTWFEEFLPTLDLSKPEVSRMSSDSVLFWLKNYHLDGLGFDAPKHVPDAYWRELSGKIKDQVSIPEKRQVFLNGITYGTRELIRNYVNPGELNGQVDIDLLLEARKVFGRENGSFKDLNYTLQESFSNYGEHSLMGNISGNPDISRFVTLASGALKPGEDESKAGWARDIEVKDSVGYAKLASLLAFNFTIPGIPYLLYGDEIGLSGAGFPDNSRMMRFEKLSPAENMVKAKVDTLAHLRSKNLALTYGDFKTIQVSDKIYIYMRTYFDKIVIVLFNKEKESKNVAFDLPKRFENTKLTPHFRSVIQAEKEKISVTLKPNSFEILTN